MAERLTGDDRTIETEGVRITSPGLTGTVEVHLPGTPGLRAAEASTGELQQALSNTGFLEQLTVEIRDPEAVPVPQGAPTRSTALGEPALAIEVPGPGSGRLQVLLAADEDGVVSWRLPEDVPPAEAPTRGGERRTYLLPRTVVARPTGGHRGLLGAIGKKVFKFLTVKLIDPVLGKITDHFVSKWEKKNRPYRLRSFTPDDYAVAGGTELGPADLARLTEGRALIFVHGTMSTTHGAFRRLPRDLVAELDRRYGGRLLAIDHPTVSVTPAENAQEIAAVFAERMEPGRRLEVDLVAHSRGGLVARELAERQALAGMPEGLMRFGSVVLVAAPNDGSVLADRHHLSDFIDTYTNLLELIPDNPVVDLLEVVLTVLKQLAVGAMGGLDGITVMATGSDYLRGLNAGPQPSGVTYRAIASDFEPAAGSGLGRFAHDRLFDKVFSHAKNDLVAPTDGVHTVTAGAAAFPIAEPLLFPPADAVDHSSYWDKTPTREAFGRWLTG